MAFAYDLQGQFGYLPLGEAYSEGEGGGAPGP